MADPVLGMSFKEETATGRSSAAPLGVLLRILGIQILPHLVSSKPLVRHPNGLWSRVLHHVDFIGTGGSLFRHRVSSLKQLKFQPWSAYAITSHEP